MIKTTQRELRNMVKYGQAVDITYADCAKRDEIMKKEDYLSQIAYAAGVYGCNGQLFRGHKSGRLYAITSRTQAIYLF